MKLPKPTVHRDHREHEVSVWQAQGILMEILGCNAKEASDLIRKRSIINGRGTIDTARLIVSTGALLAG